jgi:hypothetical protein
MAGNGDVLTEVFFVKPPDLIHNDVGSEAAGLLLEGHARFRIDLQNIPDESSGGLDTTGDLLLHGPVHRLSHPRFFGCSFQLPVECSLDEVVCVLHGSGFGKDDKDSLLGDEEKIEDVETGS